MSKLLEDQQKHINMLKAIVPVLQVTTMKHAKSNDVINYVMDKLNDGKRYDVIRAELGLGSYDKSDKWKAIRTIVTEIRMPEIDETEFLEAKDDMNYWVKKLEDIAKKIDAQITARGNPKNIAALLKAELDSIHRIIEAKSTSLKTM